MESATQKLTHALEREMHERSFAEVEAELERVRAELDQLIKDVGTVSILHYGDQ
jgi:hypothetical protein